MALTDNLVAYWKFDESSGNAADSVGSLTLTNTSVTYSAGKINNGADCGTGVSSNVGFVGGTPVWNMGAGAAKSYAFWFKCNANPTAFARVLDWRRSAGSGGEHSLMYYNDSGTYRFQFYTNGGSMSAYDTTLTVGTWYYLTMTCDASNNVNFYINGTSVRTGTWGSTGTASNFTQINGANGATSGGFSGPFSFDEFGVWSRELTSGEITSLYNGGAGLQYPFSTAYSMAAALGTFALTGIAAALIRGYTIVAAPGTYTLTGINALFTKTLTMALSAGTYTLTGIDAALSRGYGIAASVGAYTLTGIDTAFTKALTMAGALGTYTLTGVAATFSKGISLVASAGSYVLTGFAVRFPTIYTALTKHSTSYSASTKNSTSYSGLAKTTTAYTPIDKSDSN